MGADKMRMGDQRLEVIRFTHEVFDAIHFASSAHMSQDAVRSKILGIEYKRGATATGKAMNEAVRVFHDSGRKAADVANAVDLGKRGLCPLHYVTGPHDLC